MLNKRKNMLNKRKISCAGCTRRQDTEWGFLDEHQVEELDRAKVVLQIRGGQTIFFQGNPCTGLYAVRKGTVLLRRTDVDGHSAIVRMVEKGQTMGYRAFFSSTPVYGASAEASTDCTLCFISREQVNRLLTNNPRITLAFLQRLADDLDGAETCRLQFSKLPVRGRVSQILLLLKHHHGEVNANGDIVIDLPISRQELAEMVGARPESVSRAITVLHNKGVAEFRGRKVTISDLDLLLDEVEAIDD